MNILKKITIVFFSLLFSSMTVAADDSALGDLSQYTVMLCGKVSNEVLDDVGSHEKSEPLSKMIDLLILISTDAPNSVSDARVTADGKIFLKGRDTISFPVSLIMTLDGGVHTDTVTYISNRNKLIGGHFYNSENDTGESEEVYISSTGSVYHIEIEKISNESCFNKFS
ncbi:MAG: hypothetical protein SOI28_14255 [Rahnella inusitata]|jgi:hypothetical protein|uniref:hypothetical protein n=1 Tax=Rahnella inusitata TaxID=58169 RepID=UPI002F381019